MLSAMASQIIGVSIVYSIVCSGADEIKHQSSASLAFVREFTGEFPAQRASNAENVFIWLRDLDDMLHCVIFVMSLCFPFQVQYYVDTSVLWIADLLENTQVKLHFHLRISTDLSWWPQIQGGFFCSKINLRHNWLNCDSFSSFYF